MAQKKMASREKVMVLILAILLTVLAYFFLIDKPVRDSIAEAEAERARIQQQIGEEEQTTASMMNMRNALEGINYGADAKSHTPEFNNAQTLYTKLNDVLLPADEKEFRFSNVSTDERLVERNVQLSFSAQSYGMAVSIIKSLNDCPFTNNITSMSISSTDRDVPDVTYGKVRVALTMVFYELSPQKEEIQEEPESVEIDIDED